MAFVYDEDGTLLGEYDNGSAKGRGLTEYIWLPTAQGPIPIGMHKNGAFYAVHADHLGTPRLITDSANTPAWQWPYSAFGNNKPTGPLRMISTGTQVRLTATEPAAESNARLPGQYADSENGLNHNGFRTYDPRVRGGYIQPDPTGLPGGLNLYLYANGSPLMFKDPRGLDNPSMGPYGPYWTEPDCSYYQDRCTQSGGSYYCTAAPQLCSKWPGIVRPPGGRPDWVSCVRVCLQSKDNQCDQTPANSCNTSGVNMSCNVRIHQECWTQCYGDSQ